MANVLIINEKPSVSREFARALGVKQTEKHDGYIEGYSDFFGCTIWITWCIGHLVTLSFPEKYDEKYKNWNIDDLPFLPKEYLYEVIPNVKKQFNVVKRLLNTVGTSDKDKKELSTLSDVKKFLVPVDSLRMRPDRIIVGEVRGKEAVDMLQSVNVGHSAMTTVHANSVRDVVSRLETMVLMGMEMPISAIRRQIVSGFDFMIHLGRLKDGSRKVLEIAEPVGFLEGEVQMKTIYRFVGEGMDDRGRIIGQLRKVEEGENN